MRFDDSLKWRHECWWSSKWKTQQDVLLQIHFAMESWSQRWNRSRKWRWAKKEKCLKSGCQKMSMTAWWLNQLENLDSNFGTNTSNSKIITMSWLGDSQMHTTTCCLGVRNDQRKTAQFCCWLVVENSKFQVRIFVGDGNLKFAGWKFQVCGVSKCRRRWFGMGLDLQIGLTFCLSITTTIHTRQTSICWTKLAHKIIVCLFVWKLNEPWINL